MNMDEYKKNIMYRFNTLDKYIEESDIDEMDCSKQEFLSNYDSTKNIIIDILSKLQFDEKPLIGYDYNGKCFVEWHKYKEYDFIHIKILEKGIRITKYDLKKSIIKEYLFSEITKSLRL
jgi:hypothetical protein